MALPRLTWVLCDQVGEPLPGGHVATGRRLLAARNRSMEARLSLGLHDEAAIALFSALRNGIPQLRVYLGADPDPVFSGHWTPMRGSNSVDSPSTLELVFKDAFSRLAYRYTNHSVTYTEIDAGEIAHDLIEDTNATLFDTPGFTGVAVDSSWIEPTKVRDRTYDNKNIAEAIIELTEVLQGFDWFPVYTDPRDNAEGTTMEFHVAASVGTDQPAAIFEYGQGTKQNCTSYSFTTGLPVTKARVLGAGGTTVEQWNIAAVNAYSIYMALVSATDVSEVVTMHDKAYDQLRLSPVHVTEFKPDPAVSPLPWRDFWIGDRIRWNVDDGAMQQQTEPRVQSIEIGFDDSDNIDDLVIGIDPEGENSYLAPANSARRYVQLQQDILRRISALER